MSKIKALVLPSECGPLHVEHVGKPVPDKDRILVKNKAIALNPADW
jgi:NADPH:quinone reductase-like Zn-dependent oxidoreductase